MQPQGRYRPGCGKILSFGLIKIPHGQEDEIGKVKFENLSRFSAVYPEYRYVFVGDSGQADALTAQLMVTKESTEGTSRVVTTFIHNLR